MKEPMKEPNSAFLYDAFREVAKRFPDKPAVIYLGTAWTYSRLKEMAERLAAALYEMGITAGDKVVIYLPNIPQSVIAWLAIQRLNAVAVVISPIYPASDLKYMVNDCDGETVFCMDTNFGYVMRILPETGLRRVIVSRSAGLLPWWKKLVGKAFDRFPHGKTTYAENIFSFENLLKRTHSTLPHLNSHGMEEIALLLYTGGTTGLPKGVPISSRALLEYAFWVRKVSESLVTPGEGVLLQGAPLFHIFGQLTGIAACLCIAGDTMILAPRVNLDHHFDLIQRYKVSMEYGVPSLYRMVLEHDRLDYYDLSSLKYCMVGGDSVPLDLLYRWQKRFGRPLYQGYGITEAGGVALCPPEEEAPEGAIGKVGTIPIQEIKIVDSETLEPMPYGEPGELIVRSNHMTKAYWNKPEESAAHFVHIDGRLWYRTGDIIRQDEDGWLFFVDRTADMIKHKGYRVAASEIERVLQEHPVVVAACVVGVPDPNVGERIKAFVVLKEDVKGVTGYDLQSWCRQRLASYKVPGYIEFRDMLPKSKVGKLLRRDMRAEERRKLED